MRWFTLKDFVRESNRIEGIVREPRQAEVEAHEDILSLMRPLTPDDLSRFVAIVQPGAELRAHPTQNVRVGRHIAPQGGPQIAAQLTDLLQRAHRETSLIISGMKAEPAHATHIAYEHLHPFTDGNGRSGRALWLWQMGGITNAPLGFLHTFYYQTLQAAHDSTPHHLPHAISPSGDQ